MAAQIQEIKINGQVVDYNFEGLGFRLQRFAQSATNFAQKGGDYSSTIVFPITKRNKKVFDVTQHLSGINKFNLTEYFTGEISIDGTKVFNGVFKLTSISDDGYTGDMFADNINWIELLDDIALNEIGYVDGEPTWTTPFLGGVTMNDINNKTNEETDILAPTLIYNNTLIGDKLDFTNAALTGTYNQTGDVEVEPLEFPDSFELRPAYFGNRQGLTFEDFPPAVYYSNLLKKIFTNIGWNITGEIFDEVWFNRLYMAYVGTEYYKYNWKTLAYLYVLPVTRNVIGLNRVDLVQNFDGYQTSLSANYIFPFTQDASYGFIQQNILKTEDGSARIDRVANFKKFGVSDDDAEYLCPTDGRYKVSLKSSIEKELSNVVDGVSFLATNNLNWDDSVMVIYRKNQNGDFILNTSVIRFLQEWVTGDNTDFVEKPSDIIACINPKVYATSGYDIDAIGSPLTLNQELVTVNSSSHAILGTTVTTLTCESAADIEIEVDMLKNERIGAMWITMAQLTDLQFAVSKFYIEGCDLITNVDASEFTIEYLCGTEELDIATNLPAVSCKDFVTSFFNQFGLNFTVNYDSRTVDVAYNRSFYGDRTTAYEIDDRVDVRTVKILPTEPPKKFVLGYTNDTNDYLLNNQVSACTSDGIEVSNYANVFIEDNDNIYAEGELNVRNIFSPTKFQYSTFNFVDPTTYTPTLVEYTDNFTQLTFNKGIVWSPPFAIQRYVVPSIQSQVSRDATVFEGLEYNYDYQPRILYHIDVANEYFGFDTNLQIAINAPDCDHRDEAQHWIQATVSQFDQENGAVYRTLKYDGVGGLYNSYFENTIELFNNTHIIECDAYLRTTDWIELQPNRLVKYQDDVYKLLEIADYDPTGVNPSTLKLIKVI